MGEIDISALDSAVFKAMTESLDDKWSYYLTAGEYKTYKDIYAKPLHRNRRSYFQEFRHGAFRNYFGYKGLTARRKAGIKAGQTLIAIDDETLSDMEIGQRARFACIKGRRQYEADYLIR